MPTDSHRKLTPIPASGMRPAVHSPRDWAWRRHLALEFTNQALRTWGYREVCGLCQALIASGHLAPKDPLAGRILLAESNLPAVAVTTSPWKEGEPAVDVKPVLRAAWLRVLVALRGMLRVPQDDRFVNAALYTGRVERSPQRDGSATWEPRLAEGQLFSDWILALFAADALADRDGYDRHLQICPECSLVSFTNLRDHACENPLEPTGHAARRPTVPDLRVASDKSK